MNLIKFRYKNLKTYNKFCAIELNINNNNNKQIINFINLYNYIKQSFALKNIYINYCEIKTTYNTIFITLSIYFSTLYLNKLKKKSRLKLLSYPKKKISLIPNKFIKANKFQNSYIQFVNLNNYINNQKVNYLYNEIRYSLQSLIKKRRYVIIDFIRIITLLIDNKINIKLFSLMIGQLFSNLPKKSHNRFFLLMKKIFKLMISDNNLLTKNDSQILGIKLKIAGRIRGKTRSDTRNIVVGKVPLQAYNNNLQYYKQHIYTVYGAFGLKIWILRN